MKKSISLATLMFFLIIATSCTDNADDDIPEEGARMRITKMALDEWSNEPFWLFDYNSDNLLVKITEKRISEEDRTTEIEYNEDKKPEKITWKYYEYGWETGNINIQWTNNGSTMKFGDRTVRFDSQGRVLDDYEADGLDFDLTWYENDSLKVYYKYSGDTNTHYLGKFIFNDIKHPFSGLNSSLFVILEFALGEWEYEWQNEYCISEFKDEHYTARNEYLINEQGYPTQMETRYSDENYRDYWYFEYESY